MTSVDVAAFKYINQNNEKKLELLFDFTAHQQDTLCKEYILELCIKYCLVAQISNLLGKTHCAWCTVGHFFSCVCVKRLLNNSSLSNNCIVYSSTFIKETCLLNFSNSLWMRRRLVILIHCYIASRNWTTNSILSFPVHTTHCFNFAYLFSLFLFLSLCASSLNNLGLTGIIMLDQL